MVDFVKKCSIPMTIAFFVFFVANLAALAASSFWLSSWSNDADLPVNTQNSKYIRLSIYLVLGLSHCNHILQTILSFVSLFQYYLCEKRLSAHNIEYIPSVGVHQRLQILTR